MNILKELFAKLHIARKHMTSEYRLQKRLDRLEAKLLLLMDDSLDITKIKPATGRLRPRQEKELADAGIKVVIYANQLPRSAYPAMEKAARTILENGRALEADSLCMPIKDIVTLI